MSNTVCVRMSDALGVDISPLSVALFVGSCTAFAGCGGGGAGVSFGI